MILIPLAKGFEEIEAVSLIDILRRAELDILIGGVGTLEVEGAHGIKIQADILVEKVKSEDLEMIVLPGGWDGTYALADDADVQRLLQEMDKEGKDIAAICAAPYALNKAGVLKHNYTCYPSVENEIRQEGYSSEKNIVTDGNVMTSRGPGTVFEFALAIVEKLKGKKVAQALETGMLIKY
ncbi:MAG: DJ-1 family protein [Arcobacter sp.]|nr:MAG: DJ-1 family protein [Arcobacter sp.]